MTRVERARKLAGKSRSDSFNGKSFEKEFLEFIELFWREYGEDINHKLYKEELTEMKNLHTFLIEEISKIHEEEKSSINANIFDNHKNFKECIDELCDSKRANRIYFFKEECEHIFVGDIHSDYNSIERLLKSTGFFEKVGECTGVKLIFNGDYVDRGSAHLKCMECIMLLKYLFPKSVFLLKGNHDGGKILDDGGIKTPYGIPKEDPKEWYFPHYMMRLGRENSSVGEELLIKYLHFFDTLCLCALVNKDNMNILGVHGGIPRPQREEEAIFGYLKNISSLTDNNIKDKLGRSICDNILWSDPWEKEEELRENSGRFRFIQDELECFQKEFGIDILVRGHEEAVGGYRWFFDKKLVTVFSSGGKVGSGLNSQSAYDKVSPRVMSIDKSKEIRFI